MSSQYRGRFRFALLAVTLAVAILNTPAIVTHADDASVTFNDSTPSLGDVVNVTGKQWTPNDIVKLEICGNNAIDGAVDCNLRASVVVRIWTTSDLVASLQVVAPPSPCPCVVRISRQAGAELKKVPISITGVPTATPRSRAAGATPRLTITRQSVHGGSTVTSLVGGWAHRTVELTIRNDSAETVDKPVVTIRWGKHAQVDNVITSPLIEPLRPHEQRTVDVSFDLPSFSFGTYQFHGEVSAPGSVTKFELATSTWPVVFFFLIDLLLFLLLLVALRSVVKRLPERKFADVAIPERDLVASMAPGELQPSFARDEPIKTGS